MSNFSLPKDIRLLKRAQFLLLSKQGKKIHTGSFIAAVLEGTGNHNRIGITVSKKVGNAVVRTRIKRVIREYYRHRKDSIPGKKDINIIARKGLATQSTRQIFEKLDKLFKKIAVS